MEIGHGQATTLPHDKARPGAPRAACGSGTVHQAATRRKRIGDCLNHMGAGHQAGEVIAPIGIGNGETAILHHDAHAREPLACPVTAATSGSDTSDQGHARCKVFAQDADRDPRPRRPPAVIRDYGLVHDRTGRSIGPHGHRVGHSAHCSFGDCPQSQGKTVPVR